MRLPTWDRIRRAGLTLAAALLIASPALAAPTSPAAAAEAEAELTAAGWVDDLAGLWQRLLGAFGVPISSPQEPVEQAQGEDDTTQLKAHADKGDSGPSLDPNGRY